MPLAEANRILSVYHPIDVIRKSLYNNATPSWLFYSTEQFALIGKYLEPSKLFICLSYSPIVNTSSSHLHFNLNRQDVEIVRPFRAGPIYRPDSGQPLPSTSCDRSWICTFLSTTLKNKLSITPVIYKCNRSASRPRHTILPPTSTPSPISAMPQPLRVIYASVLLRRPPPIALPFKMDLESGCARKDIPTG